MPAAEGAAKGWVCGTAEAVPLGKTVGSKITLIWRSAKRDTMMTSYVSLLLSSAAIGALVSSLVTLFAQRLERQSRRKELVLSEAIKLAQSNMDTALRVAATGGKPAIILPVIEGVIDYHRWLTHLLKHGKISDDYTRVRDRKNTSPDK